MIFQLSKLIVLLLVLMSSSVNALEGIGSLTITSESGVVPIYLDAVAVGETPVSLAQVGAGWHQVAAKKGDQQYFSMMIEVTASQEAVISIPANQQTVIPSNEPVELSPTILPHAVSGLNLQVGYSSASYNNETNYDYGSNSGWQVGLGYDYQLFALRSRVSAGYLFGTTGGVIPVTLDLLFDQDEGRYFGMGVGAYFTSLAGGLATGWRALAGFGSPSSAQPWTFEIVDDYFHSQTTSFFMISLNFRYHINM